MKQLIDMLSQGSYRGIALVIIIVSSGITGKMREAREASLAHMGPDSSMAEFVVGTVSITFNFIITVALGVTTIILILRDAGIGVKGNKKR